MDFMPKSDLGKTALWGFALLVALLVWSAMRESFDPMTHEMVAVDCKDGPAWLKWASLGWFGHGDCPQKCDGQFKKGWPWESSGCYKAKADKQEGADDDMPAEGQGSGASAQGEGGGASSDGSGASSGHETFRSYPF